MKPELVQTIPVLPSANIERDIAWYKEKTGFETHFADNMYAVIYREKLVFHLQWHANTESDPLLGGSVVRIQVKNIQPIFEELVQRGVIAEKDLRMSTKWGTNEFGFFFDLNKNAVFIFEDVG